MPANTAIPLTLEAALVAYLTPLCPFAETVCGASAYGHDDEERFGIVGEFIALPAVIVSVESGPSMPDVPAITAAVTVTVRHGIDSSTAATHKTDAVTTGDALWDLDAMTTALHAADGLICSGAHHDSQGFVRRGRAYESTFQLTVEASCKS